MTEYYNNDEINGRHLVLFSPPEKKDYWYYVFELKKHVKCTPLNYLPYGLCSFKLDMETPENKVVITCNSSYRLKDYEPKEITDTQKMDKRYKRMWKEKEWRDSIVKDGAEMDYFDNKKECWIKAKVCWVKADIIPGVMLIGPRECPGMSIGYFFKESTALEKSCTHTEPIPQEKLDEEVRQKLETKARIKRQKMQAREWMEKIGMKNVKQYNSSSTKFVDTIQCYNSLNKYNTPITLKHLLEITEDEEQREKYINVDNYDNRQGSIEGFGFVAFETLKNYQVVYNIHKREIRDIVSQYVKDIDSGRTFHKSFGLRGADAYSDIKVYNATYAYLISGGICNEKEYNTRVDFSRVDMYFTLPDITYENPLFSSCSGASLEIYTDGTDIEYRYIFLDANTRTLFGDFGNGFAISHFPSLNRMLFTGHVWLPSFGCEYGDLIDAPLPEKKEKEGKCVIEF